MRTRAHGDRLHANWRRQSTELAPFVAGLGVSVDTDPDAIRRRLAGYGITVRATMPVLASGFMQAVVWHPILGEHGGRTGLGRSESEAICHAAARVYLAFQERLSAPDVTEEPGSDSGRG